MLSAEALKQRTQPTEWAAGERLAARGLLRELRRAPGLAEYMITEEPYALVRLRADAPSECDCGQPYCRHLAAAMLAAEHSGAQRELENYHERHASEAFYEAVESIIPHAPTIQLEPSIFVEGGSIWVSLRAGEGRLYVVRNLPRFLQALRTGEAVETAPNLTLTPRFSSFSPQEAAFLRILLSHVQALEYLGNRLTPQQARKMPLSEETALRALGALRTLRFRLTVNGTTRMQKGIQTLPMPAVFYVSGNRNGLRIRAQMDQPCTLAVRDGSFMLCAGQLVCVQREDRALARVVLAQEEKVFSFPRGDVSRVTGELLPTLMRSHAVILDERLERRMIRRPLKARVYLDQAGGSIVAKVRFAYGDIELDPFSVVAE